MRPWLVLLCVAGCFSEPNTSGGGKECVDKAPGCDCGEGDTCDAGLECVVSIDKCVPLDCTPGTRTCLCTDAGGCDGELVCDGGVCLEPRTGSTGNETNAGTSTADPSSITAGSSTNPTDAMSTTGPEVTSSSSTGSNPLDTSSTEPTDPTMPSESSSSEGGPVDCVSCLQDSSIGACMMEYAVCVSDSETGGCDSLQACVFANTALASCCDDNQGTVMTHLYWNAFVFCAQANECMNMCSETCV
jgi:hypothetical protein